MREKKSWTSLKYLCQPNWVEEEEESLGTSIMDFPGQARLALGAPRTLPLGSVFTLTVFH